MGRVNSKIYPCTMRVAVLQAKTDSQYIDGDNLRNQAITRFECGSMSVIAIYRQLNNQLGCHRLISVLRSGPTVQF